MENKQRILDLLLPTLQATNNLDDLINLEYIEDSKNEIAVATFANGSKKETNISMDSGTSMIKDILKEII